MKSELPFDGDAPGDGDDVPYKWLDEWLCEYVDGTMDPSLEAVFEQYVEANPKLRAHVQRLKQTRELLCECSLSAGATEDLESEICTEVECDLMASSAPLSDAVRARPLAAAGILSSVAIALVIGFLVGATVVGSQGSGTPISSVTDAIDGEAPSVSAPVQQTQTRVRPVVRRSSVSPLRVADSTQQTFSLTTIGVP